MRSSRLHLLAALALSTAGAACGGDAASGPAARQVTLSFTTGGAGNATAGAAIRPVIIAAGGHSLDITTAQVVFSRTELVPAGTTACAGDDGGGQARDEGRSGDGEGEHECDDLHSDPLAIDLPVDASVVTRIDAPVPAGTYSAFEAKIRVVRPGDPGVAAFLAAHPELAGASVRVVGTFDGAPFVYTGRAEGRIEMAFDPPIVVGSDGLNITVHVDLARWFTDGAGALIDPSTANPGGPTEELVSENIKRSFHAFEDDDHDGEDDHHGSHDSH